MAPSNPQPSQTKIPPAILPEIPPSLKKKEGLDCSVAARSASLSASQKRGLDHASTILGKSSILNSPPRETLTNHNRPSSQNQMHASHLTGQEFLDPLPGKTLTSGAQSWLLKTITKIVATTTTPLNPPAFMFEPTIKAAEHNRKFIQKCGGVEQAIQAQANSPVSYGSEFRPTWCLRPLMNHHPLWSKTESLIVRGTKYPLTPIPDSVRKKDVAAAMTYGNHKSTKNSDTLSKSMSTEIEHGFALPLPPNFAYHLPDAEVAPHGIVQQGTINERGEIIEKNRVTHDQSYPGSYSNESVNSRVIDEDLAPCLYGHMNQRCIHYIIGCRQRHPSTRILISKIDWETAYRRQHLNSATAVKSLTQVIINGITILLMALRLTFGGKPCPSDWGCISEPVADLATDILHCPDWDPTKLHSPIQIKFPRPSLLPDSTPFSVARDTIVDIPAEDSGKCDVYIDDTIAIGLDLPGNAARLEAAIPLAIQLTIYPMPK